MAFDPVNGAKMIHSMITNNTLIDSFNKEELSQCLNHSTLNFSEIIYVLKKVQAKYDVTDAVEIARHICTDIEGNSKFDSGKIIEFLGIFSKFLDCKIFDSIVDMIKSAFSNDTQNQADSNEKPAATNKNMEELTRSDSEFYTVYNIFDQIAQENDIEAMKYGIDKKYCDIKNSKNRNIIIEAAAENNFQLARLMIDCGANFLERDTEGLDTFAWFCSNGNFEAVRYFLRIPNFEINSHDLSGKTPFVLAAKNGHQSIVRLLLNDVRINTNTVDKENTTPLMEASSNGHIEVVKMLLTIPGINVNAKDKNMKTALMRASSRGHLEVVKKLLTMPGIDVNAKNSFSMTAKIEALFHGHHEVVRSLNAAGAA